MLAPPIRAHLQPSPWTDDLTHALKVLWADSSLSASYIASELGVTKNSVIGKVGRLGLPKRRDAYVRRTKRSANLDRSATMRIKTLKVRGASNGGAQLVESVLREEAPQPAEFLGVTFGDLADDQCKFPRGEGRDIRFCGQPQASGQPYCRNCCTVAFTYTPPPARAYLPTGGSKLRVF